MATEKLTAMTVKNLKEPGYHNDGGGLYFRIADGRRSWMFRYKIGKKNQWMGLGSEGDYSLAEARKAAEECRKLVKDGKDPIRERKAAKAAALALAGRTFEAVADEYIGDHKAGWKNEKHGKQWRATLEAYVFPLFGETPVNDITVDDVLGCLKPIWRTKPETASRVRGRIENVLDYARTRGWRMGENPARWRGHLDNLLPPRAKIARVVHHAALPWAEMPAIMKKLAGAGGTSALCLRFTILTAARSGEARGARWSEIDLAAKTWTLPPERMKAGQPHRVPLSHEALAILAAVAPLKGKAADGLVFRGGKAASPLSDVALSKALAAAAPDVTVHGMRSAFRDWCAERTAYPREVCEQALAHSNRDRVEAAYRRSDLFEQRARLMQQWGTFCTTTTGAAGVVPIRQTA